MLQPPRNSNFFEFESPAAQPKSASGNSTACTFSSGRTAKHGNPVNLWRLGKEHERNEYYPFPYILECLWFDVCDMFGMRIINIITINTSMNWLCLEFGTKKDAWSMLAPGQWNCLGHPHLFWLCRPSSPLASLSAGLTWTRLTYLAKGQAQTRAAKVRPPLRFALSLPL
jgi:hypothetical protein